jgi:hypothetical protein
MVYGFKKAEMDYAGDVYTIDVDGKTYLLVYSSLTEVKDNQLHWVVYLTDNVGNVLCESFTPFRFARHNQIQELLNLLAENARNKIGVDFSETFKRIYMDILERKKAFFG